MRDLIYNKRILFITTKNLDYIRNTQEIEILQNTSKSVHVIGSSAKSYLVRLLQVYSKLLFASVKKYDLIFVGFAPQLVVPFFRRKFNSITLIEDFFISFYDTLIFDRKKFKRNGFFARLLKQWDQVTILAGDYIISDTKAHGDYFAEEFNFNRSKIHELYLEADKSIYYPRNVDRSDKLIDKFIVLYFGSILPLQGVDIVLQALDQVKEDKDLYFYIIGPVGEKLKLRSNNIEYIEWLPQDKLAQYIAMSDLCLAGHFNSEIDKAKRTVPGKAYIYNAMGKPMILGDNQANREKFIEGRDLVFYVDMGSADKLANKIYQVKTDALRSKT